MTLGASWGIKLARYVAACSNVHAGRTVPRSGRRLLHGLEVKVGPSMVRLSSLPRALILAASLLIGGGALAPAAAAAAPLVSGDLGSSTYASSASIPSSASLGPLIYLRQTYNNCGPASVAEVLRYWGIVRSQAQVQAVLRADGNPGGMSPYGVPGYMDSLGMDALMGVNGTDDLVKALVANGFPVVVSQWVSLSDRYGHYRPIEAYDDAQGGFVSSDPYLGPGHFISYGDFDRMWASRHQQFFVLYPPSQQGLLDQVLADVGWDHDAAYAADLAQQQRHLNGTSPYSDSYSSPYPSYPGFGRASYAWLNVAWDEAQLGQTDAASAALQEASARGANKVLVRWIAEAAGIG